jgi:Rieske Fe-S protein
MKDQSHSNDAEGKNKISRRNFLKALALSGGAVTVGSWLAACGSGNTAPAPSGAPVNPSSAPAGAANGVTLDLTKPENQPLAAVGGILALEGNPVDATGLFVYRQTETTVLAFSRKCTHLGCTVNAFQQGVASCPCHGSQYDLSGTPVKGPAAKQLHQYSASLKGTMITIS